VPRPRRPCTPGATQVTRRRRALVLQCLRTCFRPDEASPSWLCRLSAAPSSRRGAGETSLAALHETVGMTGPVGRTSVGVFWQRPRPPDAWLPRVHIQSPSDGLPRRSALMAISRRRTGIPPVGDIAWGTHICLLYQTPTDVLEMLVAYVHAGLEAHEYCLIGRHPP